MAHRSWGVAELRPALGVNVLGTHVPLSGWTVAALVAGTGLSLLLWRPLSRRWRWRPPTTLLSLLSLTVVLAMTVTPEGTGRAMGLRACIPYDLPDLGYNIVHTGGGVGGNALNLVLMLPLTFSLVLASRRVSPAACVALLLPFAVELAQTVVPGRYCGITDVVTNCMGALLGVCLGGLVLRYTGRSS